MTRDPITAPPAVVIDAEADALATFVAIEARVERAEHDSILARWEFGRRLLAERDRNGGKQLPHGRLAEVCAAIGKSQAEVRTRMQFAAEYATRDEVATAVATFKSWTEIRDRLGRRGQAPPPPQADCTAEEARARTDEIRAGLDRMQMEYASAPVHVAADVAQQLLPMAEQIRAGTADRNALWSLFFADSAPEPELAVFAEIMLFAVLEGCLTAIGNGAKP